MEEEEDIISTTLVSVEDVTLVHCGLTSLFDTSADGNDAICFFDMDLEVSARLSLFADATRSDGLMVAAEAVAIATEAISNIGVVASLFWKVSETLIETILFSLESVLFLLLDGLFSLSGTLTSTVVTLLLIVLQSAVSSAVTASIKHRSIGGRRLLLVIFLQDDLSTDEVTISSEPVLEQTFSTPHSKSNSIFSRKTNFSFVISELVSPR
mmetsp:Transcript_41887/g.48890  ORF Transcript_41887/g.48890 Transcript_41887/m.48890 type:complete len:211 (-) Transcript_41887:3057-3689(-)